MKMSAQKFTFNNFNLKLYWEKLLHYFISKILANFQSTYSELLSVATSSPANMCFSEVFVQTLAQHMKSVQS